MGSERQGSERQGGDPGSDLVLEIHDAGLAVMVPEGAPDVPPSPGFALLDGSTLHLGAAARGRSRLSPHRVHHRFWQELDASAPLPRPFPREWTPADLAHAHLEELRGSLAEDLRESPRLILAVPGSLDAGQLGLLLGIARSLEMPVAGLVDSAVAACRWACRGASRGALDPTGVGDPAQPRLLHLDLHLHRAVLTEVAWRAGRLRRRRVKTVEGTGLLALEDAWAREISTVFLRATRFDPLHSARTEQVLYDQLPGWLQEVERRGSAVLVLPGGGKPSVEVSRGSLVAAVDGLYHRLTSALQALAGPGTTSPGTAVLLSHHAAALPGLAGRLGSAGYRVGSSSPGDAGRGALAARREILSPSALEGQGATGLPLVLRLREPRSAGGLRGAP